MGDTKGSFELISAEDALSDEAVGEMALMFAHEKAVEELDRSEAHGYWSDDPEAMLRQEAWLNALGRFLPRLERVMAGHGMAFTPYKPFKDRYPEDLF